MASVDIGICTFRRAAVVDTLASLARQDLPVGVTLRAIVADNDEQPEARERVMAAAAEHRLDVTYVHAPSRNICIARNACLDAATAPFLAFIDDDETATPGWIVALLNEARREWDAVLGPVKALYAPDAPTWMADADFHSTAPVVTAAGILKGYAGNVLLRRDTVERLGLRFDLSLGRKGGEDDDFFYRLTDAGGRIGYAPDALAYEPVPAPRTSLDWLLKRSFRTGQTHGSRLSAKAGGALGKLAQASVAAAKGGVCVAGAAATALSPTQRSKWLVRGALHAGVVARLAGMRELQLY